MGSAGSRFSHGAWWSDRVVGPVVQRQTVERELTRLSRIAAGLVVLIAGVVLAGWTFRIEALQSLVANQITVKTNTAICLFLLGVTELLTTVSEDRRVRHLGNLVAFVAGAIGLVTLGEYLTGAGPGFDQWLFSEPVNSLGTSSPGRMAPNTAFAIVMAALALSLIQSRTRWVRSVARALFMLVSFAALVGLLGFFYGEPGGGTSPRFTHMAMPTALAFLLLSAGFYLSRRGEGWIEVLFSESSAGSVARLLVPAGFFVPLLFGWIRMTGERLGLYGSDFGLQLSIAFTIVALMGVAVWATSTLERVEWRRNEAERARRSFFTLSLDLLCIADSEGRFVELNPAWERVLGYPVGDLIGRPFLDLVHPDDRARTLAEAEKLRSGGETVAFEDRYRAHDGTYRTLRWSTAADAERGLLYAAAHDVTDLRASEQKVRVLNRSLEATVQARTEALERTVRELEAFSYSVSHDLRTPLRSIDGFSRVILEKYENQLDEQGRDYLGRIRRASQRMAHLIDDMLKLSRVMRGDLDRRPLNLSVEARAVVEDLRNAEPQRHVDVRIAEGLIVHADRRMIQVVQNLIGNAWKFTGARKQAEIEFGSMEQNGEMVYFVRDNGAGFDMRYANKLFGAFQRLHRTDEFEGTGIGLATVQRIVHLHNGRIWAEAEVDRGATFYFTVPAASPGDQTESDRAAQGWLSTEGPQKGMVNQ